MHEHMVLENSMDMKRQLTLCLNTSPWRGIGRAVVKFCVFYTFEHDTDPCHTLDDCIFREEDTDDYQTEGSCSERDKEKILTIIES